MPNNNLHLPKIYSITVSKPSLMDVFKGRGPSGVSLTESDAYGVQVKRLDHDSPFYESKLMPGMILLSIQGHAGILKMAHASRLLQEADSPVTILTAKTLSSIDTHYIKLKACNVLTTGINTGSGQYMLGIRFAQVCSVLVRVSFLADNSPLHGQLKVGDIILSINGQAVSHPDHAARLVRSTNHAITDLGGTVVFQVWDVHAFLIQHVVVPALTESGLAGTNNAETFQRSLRYDELWKEMYLSHDPSYRFVVDEEYLRVSHKEPWRHFKSGHGGKPSEGGKVGDFERALDNGNAATRHFVGKLQQLVWQAELGELGAVVGKQDDEKATSNGGRASSSRDVQRRKNSY